MKFSVIHIPTAIRIQIPKEYCYDYACVESYLALYAWTHCLTSIDNRAIMSWLHLSREDKESLFRFRLHEFEIAEE